MVSGGATSAEFSTALPAAELTNPPTNIIAGTVTMEGGAPAAECLVFVRVSQFISFLQTDIHALWVNILASRWFPENTWWAIGQPLTITIPTRTCLLRGFPSRLWP